MPKVNEYPGPLKPYFQHRVEINYKEGAKEAVGTCPFCDKDYKFYVNVENGMYSCKSCGEAGNHYSFIRKLHFVSTAPTAELEVIAEERKLDVRTLIQWGLVKSSIDREWILPAYGVPKDKKSEINNLYRWTPVKRKDGTYKRRLMATAELPACMFGLQFWDQSKPDLFITEGPWDGMKLWETFRRTKAEGMGGLARTTDPNLSIYKTCNVLSVPGCETFKEGWERIMAGKRVMILYDNDHPRRHKTTNTVLPPVGFEGLKKAAGIIRTVAESVHVLLWGEQGYDPNLPDGYDIRDLLGV